MSRCVSVPQVKEVRQDARREREGLIGQHSEQVTALEGLLGERNEEVRMCVSVYVFCVEGGRRVFVYVFCVEGGRRVCVYANCKTL